LVITPLLQRINREYRSVDGCWDVLMPAQVAQWNSAWAADSRTSGCCIADLVFWIVCNEINEDLCA
jgi:hypothetical protein